MSTTKAWGFIREAEKALIEDDDYLRHPTDEELAWLVAQLACWPRRVDEESTTNHRFLLMSAANLLMQRFLAEQEAA